MKDWTKKPEVLRETIQTNLKEMCPECSEWEGLCDVCCIRVDYNTVLRTLIEMLLLSRMRDTCSALRPLTNTLNRCHVPYTVENEGRNILFGGVFVTHTKWGLFRVLNGLQTYESNDITATMEWAFRHADDDTRKKLGYK